MRRLLIACALLLWGGMAAAQSSDYIKYYPPAGLSTMTGTATATTTTVPLLLPNGSAAAPSLAWASDPAVGFYKNAQGFNLSNAGVQVAVLNIGGLAFLNYSAPTVSLNNGEVVLGVTGLQGKKSKTLTDAAAAVSFVRIAVPTNGYIGGKVIATANSTDGTNRLTTTSEWYFAGADTAGTVTCGAPSAVGTPATAYRRGNTLVCTMTSVTSTTNCDLQITCTDDLAGDQTPIFGWRLDMPSAATVTPQ